MHTHSMCVQILFRAMGMAHHTSVSHSSVLMNLISVTKNGVCECCSFALHRQSLCESGVAHVCKRVARIRWQVFVVNVRGHVLTKSICLLCSVGAQDDIGGVSTRREARSSRMVGAIPSLSPALLLSYIHVDVSEVRRSWYGNKMGCDKSCRQ